jgi:transposase-like protein
VEQINQRVWLLYIVKKHQEHQQFHITAQSRDVPDNFDLILRSKRSEWRIRAVNNVEISVQSDRYQGKTLSIYAAGMRTMNINIAEQIKTLNDVKISAEMVNKISGRILPEVMEWQNRQLDESYPFVFMDTIYNKVRDKHQINNGLCRAGVNSEGYKDTLGIWIAENKSSIF